MTISIAPLLRGTAWTVGSYGIGQALRLVTNIILARLLAPELFGIMLIVNSIKQGITLLGDFGIAQSIVYNKNANEPEFYNTAWSLELIRNTVLCIACLALTAPLAAFYQTPILIWVLPFSAITFLLTGLTSVSRHLLQKRMEISRLTTFETIVAVIGSFSYVVFAYFSPTIWALVAGGLCGSLVYMIGSHFLLRDIKPRLLISVQSAQEILRFGKWIFVSSIIFFLSMNYDRLYLPTILQLQVLGVYGVARSVSEMLGALTTRLGSGVLFPFIASHAHMPRSELKRQLASTRAKFLLLAALGISFLVATIDFAVIRLYDERYHDAGWMLPVLVFGSWFSVLATVNDSTLVGLGKPSYSAAANCGKFVFLVIGLPVGFAAGGVPGVVFIVALADLWRYVPIFIGQRQEGVSFAMQDGLLTLWLLLFIAGLEWLRWILGFGTSFDELPISMNVLGGVA